jgi:hypothetical protein
MTDIAPTAPAHLAWPSHFAVAHMPGSLPMGGVVPMTPIFAFREPAPRLALSRDHGLTPQRTDIELGGLIAFLISDVITPEEADAIVEASERFGYRDEAPGIQTPPGMRMNKAVHWVADEQTLGPIFDRIAHLLPHEIDGAPLHPALSRRIKMYRYDAEDVFNPHTDGDWPGYGLTPDRRQMDDWPGMRSCFSMLLYLNGPEDGVQGGSTRLFRPDRGHVDVTPKKGSALFFRHGFGPRSVLHEGCRVFGEVSKYVARINVMYHFG